MTLLEKMKAVRQNYKNNTAHITAIRELVNSRVGEFLWLNRLGYFYERKEITAEYNVFLESSKPDDPGFTVLTVKDFKVSLSDLEAHLFSSRVSEVHDEVCLFIHGQGKVSSIKFEFEFDSRAKLVGKSYSDLHLIDYKGNLKKGFTAFDIEKAILVDAFIDPQDLDDFIMINQASISKENMQ